MIWLLLACNQGTEKEQEQTCSVENYALLENEAIVLPQDACQTLSLRSQILGEGTLSLRWEQHNHQLQPIISASGDATFQGLVLNGSYTLRGENEIRLWKQGYQSWWWSGVTDLVEPELDEYGIPLTGGDDHGTSATEEKPYSSWWNGLVGKEAGDSLLFGALSSTRTRVWSAFSDHQAWLVWGHRGDEIALADGEELHLDPVWIKTHTDPFDLHVEYAQAAAAYHQL
ncbi:MAG: hypothetical protein VX278_15125 [Myxococcota bacterium]|nr:hypothetical protein [Myxococcota bacterium]